jgi:hypothetical protein
MNDRPIFVVGCARSGTTMLQLMLHAHHRIAIPPETRFLMPAYDNRQAFGDLTVEANRRKLAEHIVTRRGSAFKDLGLDTHETIEEIVARPPTIGSAVGIVFRAYARKHGKPRWGDKRPAYLLNLDMITTMFPDAQIVHIVRDGRDCVASLKETTWHQGGVYKAISDWTRGTDEGRRAAGRLGPDSYFDIYYERLVSDPETELRKLCEFLGEEFDPAMTAPNQLADVAVPSRKTWHALTHQAPTDERIGSWAKRLEPWEIGLCEAVMGDRLVGHGYKLSGEHRAGADHLARYAKFAARSRLSKWRRRATVAYQRVNPPKQVAAQLTSAERALAGKGGDQDSSAGAEA